MKLLLLRQSSMAKMWVDDDDYDEDVNYDNDDNKDVDDNDVSNEDTVIMIHTW